MNDYKASVILHMQALDFTLCVIGGMYAYDHQHWPLMWLFVAGCLFTFFKEEKYDKS